MIRLIAWVWWRCPDWVYFHTPCLLRRPLNRAVWGGLK